MKIAQIFNIPQFKTQAKVSNQYANLKPLSFDTVSFSGFIGSPVHDNNIDLSLYPSVVTNMGEEQKYNAFRFKQFRDGPYSTENAVLEHLQKYAAARLEDEPEFFEDYTHKYYDLPEKFAIMCNNTWLENGGLLLTRKVPDIFNGIEMKEVSAAMDILPVFLEMDAVNKFKIGDREFKATPLSNQGSMGKTFKLQKADEPFGGHGYLLKVYDPSDVTANGPYGETAIAITMTKEKVRDIPRFYMGNPVGKFVNVEGSEKSRTQGSWQISEFIEKGTPIRKSGIKLHNWLEKKQLNYTDDLDRNMVGEYVVDLGSITNGVYPNKLNYRDYDLYCAMFGQILGDYHGGKDAAYYLEYLEEMKASAQP